MADGRRNNLTDKHFQNGQRRHKENEAQSNMGRDCRRTEESNVSLLQPRRRLTESARFDVSTERPAYGHVGNNDISDGTPQYLPNPSGIYRELQRYPEHLWEIIRFNHSTQRSNVPGGNNSESHQYKIEMKKEVARKILTQAADQWRANSAVPDQKMIEGVLESLEAAYLRD